MPFIIPVRGRDVVTVPYTFHLNDIVSFPFDGWNAMAYEQALKDEFDQLYEEGARRRRMMVISLHDRISGHAGRVRVLRGCPARTEQSRLCGQTTRLACSGRIRESAQTPVLDRGPAGRTGLPGSATRQDQEKRPSRGRPPVAKS